MYLDRVFLEKKKTDRNSDSHRNRKMARGTRMAFLSAQQKYCYIMLGFMQPIKKGTLNNEIYFFNVLRIHRAKINCSLSNFLHI